MTSVILIPWPLTNWQVSGRYASKTPVAMNEQGEEQLERYGPITSVSASEGTILAHSKKLED